MRQNYTQNFLSWGLLDLEMISEFCVQVNARYGTGCMNECVIAFLFFLFCIERVCVFQHKCSYGFDVRIPCLLPMFLDCDVSVYLDFSKKYT